MTADIFITSAHVTMLFQLKILLLVNTKTVLNHFQCKQLHAKKKKVKINAGTQQSFT